jgi:ATP-grasp ribosomal peptide maturase
VKRPTVLVLASSDDDTADLVVDALAPRRVRVARVDTADFPASVSLVARPELAESPGWLRVHGERIDLASVRSVYRHHPAGFTFPSGMSEPERRFASRESIYGLGGVLAAQRWRWLDLPCAVADAAYKPRQLRIAAEVGLTVPPSLVTNSGIEARKFVAEIGGSVVYKSLSSGVVTECDELRIIYTSLLTTADLDEQRDAAIALCPILLQRWVPKKFDVRLTVVGDQCFAVAIHTDNRAAKIDWRSRYGDLTYQICQTPEVVRAGVLSYLRIFGLTYGAFDFAVTPDDQWWFLECNASGRWSWIAEETGLPIAEALADELVGTDQ